ncbi:MAG: hypothetical protein AVDCRST_MAG33-3339, partial [uncultured Thermomicrobiales bacterium]
EQSLAGRGDQGQRPPGRQRPSHPVRPDRRGLQLPAHHPPPRGRRSHARAPDLAEAAPLHPGVVRQRLRRRREPADRAGQGPAGDPWRPPRSRRPAGPHPWCRPPVDPRRGGRGDRAGPGPLRRPRAVPAGGHPPPVRPAVERLPAGRDAAGPDSPVPVGRRV